MEKKFKKSEKNYEKPYHKKKSEIYIEETTSLTERIKSEVPPSGKYSLNLNILYYMKDFLFYNMLLLLYV